MSELITVLGPDIFMNIIERQGIVAALLMVMIFQQWGMQRALLKKICTLENFIMECLKNELVQDNPTGTWVKK